MPVFAVTSIGADRPGIVAAVTKVLFDRGCNLEDTAMSILRGQFAMVMVVRGPEAVEPADLETALATEIGAFDLVTVVREIHASRDPDEPAGDPWTVVVYGPDHPGIVHVVAARLAALGVNIVDVTTRMSGEANALYSMVMEVQFPNGVPAEAVEQVLARVAAEEGLTVRLHPADADIL